jgi:diacylglycerol O-acyltransferase
VVAEVMARRLDRRRPLWEMHVVEGLDDGHWALISRVHHAVVDGVAGNALLGVILDSEPAPAHHPIVTWRARRQPSGARLLAASINQRLAIVAGLPSVARVEGWPTRGGAWSAARRWTRAQVRLQDVRAVREAFGGTVNDVALAAIANGFRQLLIARGEEPDGKCVRTLVPVSVRAPGCRREDNRVSAIFVDLPVAQSSAVERLESISEQTERAKDSGEAFAGQMAAALFELAPAPILNLGTKLSVELGQTAVQTIVSNVPGSPAPLYLLGRRAVEISAYIPVGMGLRICLAAFSYDGTLSFSITGDRDTAPDIQVLARGVTEGMAALVAAARRSGNGRG